MRLQRSLQTSKPSSAKPLITANSIALRSADLRTGLKTKRERSWSNSTLGEVLGAIASGNGLKATIAEALGGLPILQLDQANESDANLISRLGEEFDAVATVKAGCLLCMPAGGGKTASGLALPHITLTRVDGDQHRYLQADRDSYDGVRAYYYDVNSAKKQEAIGGGGENLKDLRHTYSDQQSALRAARAEFNRLQRGSATLSYTLARGRPDLIPELTYTLQGVKAEIDEIIWYGGNVQHSLSADNGYSMAGRSLTTWSAGRTGAGTSRRYRWMVWPSRPGPACTSNRGLISSAMRWPGPSSRTNY